MFSLDVEVARDEKSFLSLLLVVAFAASGSSQTGNEPRSVTELYGKALATIRNPDSVSAVLLKDRDGQRTERSRQVTLPPEAKRSTADLLSAGSSYDWNVWKPCAPRYGSRLILRRGSEIVTVDFCFECDIVTVTPAARAENSVDFHPSRASWLRLFRAQFPKDKAFKTLR